MEEEFLVLEGLLVLVVVDGQLVVLQLAQGLLLGLLRVLLEQVAFDFVLETLLFDYLQSNLGCIHRTFRVHFVSFVVMDQLRSFLG